jgi:hypothetical protein
MVIWCGETIGPVGEWLKEIRGKGKIKESLENNTETW